MRILVLTDTYPPAATGGYERSCADVVRVWRAAGHRVLVLTTGADVPAEPEVRRELRRPDADAGAHCRAVVQQALADLRPEVVSAWNLARVPVAAVLDPVAEAGVPVVLAVCDGWLHDAPADVRPCAPGSALAYVSEHLRRATHPPAWAPQRSAVVHSGIDVDVFGPDRLPAPEPDRPWGGRLLYVGRLAAAKGVEDAVSALALLPPSDRLTVVGPPHPTQSAVLDELIGRSGVRDRVDVAGPVDRPDLPRYYRAADAVLFPSRWQEPFGLVPLEAMACGTPVVATGTGGSAEYLRDGGNALLVPAGDPAALAAAVGRLARDPALRRALADAGRHTSTHYTVPGLAARLSDLLRRAVSAAS
ncbi:glycosyltransferase family 4 protein [Nakamurella endophytica]|uniref:Glycosyl transferase family 1 domain-containing protein n=1 Tax=Nakamurella endophytica TaxID=1748367 RepID=A0A917WFX9_9ACTN|nr:glycosyltransferase family 4 protein [Nakamurella endophytica]GGL99589.1 hypothetical protein GCM10011594_19440 [Nakamurella endophytica]